MTARIVVLLALSFGCAPKSPAPEGPPPARACTDMGCTNGLHVRVTKPTPWPTGAWEFALELDGTAVTCKGSLPLPPCEQSPALSCDPAGRVQIMESGCALPAEQHGWGDFQIDGEPASVKVTIRHGADVLHESEIQPQYGTVQPNGPGCEPTCRQASAAIALP